MPRAGVRVAAAALVTAAAALLAFAAGDGAARAGRADATPAAAIAKLNAQRERNGIPGGIVEAAEWSSACALHNQYMRTNGGIVTHDEEPGKPGYTAPGAWAGQNSVLGGGNWDGGNPWETAPIHLMQLLAPQLKRMGVDDSGGFVCATTFAGYVSGAADVVYTYPGDGTTGWRGAEVADEEPATPGEYVGLPHGARTGLYLFVLVDGPSAEDSRTVRIVSASLSDARGPREVRWVDSSHPEIGPYLAAGGTLIPVQPLAPATTYHASVDVEAGEATLHREWQFTTGVSANAVSLSFRRYGARTVAIAVTSTAPGPTLTLTRGTRRARVALRRLGGAYTTGRIRLGAGTYRACATSGGATSGYAAASRCLAPFRIG